jgi:hypothetical protein
MHFGLRVPVAFGPAPADFVNQLSDRQKNAAAGRGAGSYGCAWNWHGRRDCCWRTSYNAAMIWQQPYTEALRLPTPTIAVQLAASLCIGMLVGI